MPRDERYIISRVTTLIHEKIVHSLNTDNHVLYSVHYNGWLPATPTNQIDKIYITSDSSSEASSTLPFHCLAPDDSSLTPVDVYYSSSSLLLIIWLYDTSHFFMCQY